MRIAFLSAEYLPQPGGVGDYTRRLALALAEHGHTPWVITGQSRTPDEQSGTADAHPAVLRQIGAWDWNCWRDTVAALAQIHPTVLHIQYQTGAYGMHPAINLLPWRLRGLPYRPRVMVTFHDLLEPYLFPKAGRLRQWVTLRLARTADAVVVTNAADAAALRTTAGIAPHLIPIGSNIPVAPPPDFTRADWRAALGVPADALLVAYFGLLSYAKGLDILVDALRQLRDSDGPPLCLLVIGGSATAPQDRAYAIKVRDEIDRLGLGDRVIFTGHVDEAHVSAHLSASDIVALPFRGGASFRSGSLLAALLHGAAIVTTAEPGAETNAGSAPQLIDGEHALLVPPTDSHALAGALRRLAADEVLRKRLRTNAAALGARFSWDDIARQHENIYRELAQRKLLSAR